MAETINMNGLLLSVLHDYNTRHRYESVSENDTVSNHDPPVKLKENNINCIKNLKEEIVNLKEIVIK